jgi:hypothetical protein
LATGWGKGLPTTQPPPYTLRKRARRWGTLDLPSTSTMGKKSREKRAKQVERDRKKEEEGPAPSLSPGASTSGVSKSAGPCRTTRVATQAPRQTCCYRCCRLHLYYCRQHAARGRRFGRVEPAANACQDLLGSRSRRYAALG